MKIYLHIIRPLLSWFRAKTNPETSSTHPPKWVLPTITYILTLATGIWLGTMIQQPRIRRYQQLAQNVEKREKALLDSLRSITQLAAKDLQIHTQHETILSLTQQIRSDSIAHLSELEAIRAINAHLKKR